MGREDREVVIEEIEGVEYYGSAGGEGGMLGRGKRRMKVWMGVWSWVVVSCWVGVALGVMGRGCGEGGKVGLEGLVGGMDLGGRGQG